MTSIEQLQIVGIRSFSPDSNQIQKIKFFKPLTIIVGHNGAGKTTIIECLKNACCGELPPNSERGQSFVHDPKVAGESEVKAQIRLIFRGMNRKVFSVIRSFSCSISAAGKISFKQIESAIQTKNEKNEIVSHSYKCGDLDKVVPDIMGISSAMLENVIFCHQEDSTWPLGEPAKLKKKFDDIFASTRYTKALETIKKFRKEKMNDLKELTKELAVLEVTREQFHKIKKEIHSEGVKINEINLQITSLDERIAEKVPAIGELEKAIKKARDFEEELKVLKRSAEMSERSLNEFRENRITMEFEENIDELRDYDAKILSEICNLTSLTEASQRRLSEIRDTIRKLAAELNKVTSREAIAQSELKNQGVLFDKMIKDIEAFLAKNPDFASKGFTLNFPADFFPRSLGLITADSMREIARTIENTITAKIRNDISTNISQQRKTAQKSKGEKQAELDSLVLQRRELESHSRNADKLLAQKRATGAQLKRELERLSAERTDAKSQEELASRSQEIHHRITDKNAEATRFDSTQNLEKIRTEIANITGKLLPALKKEMADRDREREQLLKIELEQKSIEEQSAELESKFSLFLARCQGVAGSACILPANTKDSHSLDQMRTELIRFRDELRRAVADAEKSTIDAEKEWATNRQKRKSIDDEITKKTALIADAEKRFSDVLAASSDESDITDTAFEFAKIAPDFLKKKIDSLEIKTREMRMDVSLFESLTNSYKRFIEISQTHHICPVCERGLSAGHEVDSFVALQQSKIEKTPEVLARKKVRLARSETMLANIRNLGPVFDETFRMKNHQLPELDAAQTELSLEEKRLASQRDETAVRLKSAKEEHDKVALQIMPEFDGLLRDQTNLSKRITELDKLRNKLESTKREGRSIEQITSEHQSYTQQCDKLNSELEALRRKRDGLSSEIAELNTEWMKINNDLEKSRKLAEKLDRLATDLAAVTAEVTSTEAVIRSDAESLDELTEKIDSFRRKHSSILSGAEENKVIEVEKALDGILGPGDKIRDFCRNSGDEFERVFKLAQKTREKHGAVSEEEKQVAEESDTTSKKLQKATELKRHIDINLEFRTRQHELQNLKENIARKTEETASQYGSLGRNFAEIDGKITRLRSDHAKLKDERSKLIGMRVQLQDALKRKQQDLAENFADIEPKYRSFLIKKVSLEKALSDLEKYYSALEKALMKFHSLKMAEINTILSDLWTKTYRGQDIDAIAVCAENAPDESGTEKTSTSSRKRNFNYRVVMKKGDVALDMRSRCSAGQKVLASLMIRMALAEAFCLNCGVLALDEPTTNLDADNVSSLAEALQTIIAERKSQSNFQLVVITHDEDFVAKLGTSEYVEKFYRVTKSPQSQHSIIEEVDASVLQG